jgi:hypothetical protein
MVCTFLYSYGYYDDYEMSQLQEFHYSREVLGQFNNSTFQGGPCMMQLITEKSSFAVLSLRVSLI